MSSEAEIPQKLYYSIGEVATMLGVSAPTIRFWESEFPHLRPKTNKKGDRRYRPQDIEALKQVYTLVKEKGYTLQGAKEYIANKKGSKNQYVVDKLKELRLFLEELRRNLPENPPTEPDEAPDQPLMP